MTTFYECVGVIIIVIIVRVDVFFCVGRDKTCILLCHTQLEKKLSRLVILSRGLRQTFELSL